MEAVEIRQAAIAALHQAHLETASLQLQTCIELEPDTALNYWYLGLSYLLRGDAEVAQATWLTALLQDGTETEQRSAELFAVLEQEGILYFQWGQIPQAKMIFQHALELVEAAATHFNLGLIGSYQGAYEEAIAHLLRAVELDPGLIPAYHTLGWLLQETKRFETAHHYYTRLLAFAPAEIDAWYHSGLCLAALTRYDEAITCFQTVLQHNPAALPALAAWGEALMHQGKWVEAVTRFQQVIDQQPGFVQAYVDWYAPGLSREFNESGGDSDDSDDSDDQSGEKAPLRFLRSLLSKEASSDACRYLSQRDREAKQQVQAVQEPQQPDLAVDALSPAQFSDQREMPGRITAYSSVENWFNSVQPPGAKLTPLAPAAPFQVIPAKTLPGREDSFFTNTVCVSAAEFVVQLPDGHAYFQSTAGHILTADQELLLEVSPFSPFPNPFLANPALDEVHRPISNPDFSFRHMPAPDVRQDQTIAVLPGLGSSNYAHWMGDVVPAIGLLQRAGISLADIDYFFLHDYTGLPFQHEVLERLGIPPHRIISSRQTAHLTANRLLVPSLPGYICYPSQNTCQFLRTLFAGDRTAPSDFPRRFYIQRRKTKYRYLLNELEVLQCLEPWGFVPVQLESLTVAQQAQLFAGAEAIVAPHGAGLTNLAFCDPGTKVIEIFPVTYRYSGFWLIASHVGCDYYYLTTAGMPIPYLNRLMYPNQLEEDIWVHDLSELKQLLELAGLSRKNL